MCRVLLLFMGNAMSGAGRRTAELGRGNDGATTATADAMEELSKDVERLKAAMDEKHRMIERLGQTVDDVRVSGAVGVD